MSQDLPARAQSDEKSLKRQNLVEKYQEEIKSWLNANGGEQDEERPILNMFDLLVAKALGSRRPLPCTLPDVCPLRDLKTLQYPEGIRSPISELNSDGKDGVFRYDRGFLLQFMSLCTKNPGIIEIPSADQKERDRAQSYANRRMNRGGGRPKTLTRQGASSVTQTTMSRGSAPVAPRKVSGGSLTIRRRLIGPYPPEVVNRNVRSLLNKMTWANFDSISDQVIQWANTSEAESDARTLICVIDVLYEQITTDGNLCEMFARLCRKMMENISLKVQDQEIRTADCEIVCGGVLFRKFLINRCQWDFERGWPDGADPSFADVAGLPSNVENTEESIQESVKGKEKEKEHVPRWDDSYAGQKAKRRGLGLIKFICELFKLCMLTERIMHEYIIKRFLTEVTSDSVEVIESLCTLFMTIGDLLDIPKAHKHFDVYFSRMKVFSENGNLPLRMQFMLLDTVELRERKWQKRIQPSEHSIAGEGRSSHDIDWRRRGPGKGKGKRTRSKRHARAGGAGGAGAGDASAGDAGAGDAGAGSGAGAGAGVQPVPTLPQQRPRPHAHQHGIPVSPRQPHPTLQQPGAPPTGLSAPLPSAGGRLNTNASAFVPGQGAAAAAAGGGTGLSAVAGNTGAAGVQSVPTQPSQRSRPVKITDAAGHELDFNAIRTMSGAPSSASVPSTPGQDKNRRAAVRLETEEQKKNRLAEEEKARKAREAEEAAAAKKLAEEKKETEEEEARQKAEKEQ